MKKGLIALCLAVIVLGTSCRPPDLVNVSYDPTREFYREFNEAFAAHYEKNVEPGRRLRIDVTHGGSAAQARNVIAGLQADVVTLAIAYDIDSIAQRTDILPTDWQTRLPYNSTPYYSTVVFLVRQGNPKNIRCWEDLIRPDVEVVVADPRTSAVARLAHLAGWGYVLQRELGDLSRLHDPDAAEEVAAAHEKAREYMTAMYRNVRVLEQGARGASAAFLQRGRGDVLLDWENQAKLAINEFGAGRTEIVVPSVSILAEPPVALLDRNVDRRGTRRIAEEYLKFLYSATGQEIIARHFYRPRNEEVFQRFAHNFVDVELFTVDDVFGGWHEAQRKHFEPGGIFGQIFDQIHGPGR